MNQARFIRFFRPGLRIGAIITAVAALMPAEVRSADYEIEMLVEEYRYLNETVRRGHDGCVVRLDGRFDFAEFAERNPVTWEMEEYEESAVGFHGGPFVYDGYAKWLKHNITIFHGSGREEWYILGTLFPVNHPRTPSH